MGTPENKEPFSNKETAKLETDEETIQLIENVRWWIFDKNLLNDFPPEVVDDIMNNILRQNEEYIALVNFKLGLDWTEKDDKLINSVIQMLWSGKSEEDIKNFLLGEKSNNNLSE